MFFMSFKFMIIFLQMYHIRLAFLDIVLLYSSSSSCFTILPLKIMYISIVVVVVVIVVIVVVY